jgi:protein-S-isoprenylcysteine O-methyltransferase Ste14
MAAPGGPLTVRRWLSSTPRRTFALYPLLIAALHFHLNDRRFDVEPWGALLLVAGYAQYRFSGLYRAMKGGGGPGLDVPPQRLVTSGIYAILRNPMYLGHLVFMAGLAVMFRSWPAAALLAFHIWWFDRRAAADEKHMDALFGEAFRAYRARVRRWGLL